MGQIKLNKILKLHEKWLRGERGGKCADLRGQDLRCLDLCGANLKYAKLDYADLRYACLDTADLSYANLEFVKADHASLDNVNLYQANLRGADLTAAILTYASLYDSNLCNARFSGANLGGAILTKAVTNDVVYGETTAFFAICCPEKGSFTGFKRCGDYIVELLIPEDAKRSSATSRECRCDKAKVISITNLDGTDSNLQTVVASDYDREFIYTIGEYVCVSDFDNNRWHECAPGIYFFITRGEAVNYDC